MSPDAEFAAMAPEHEVSQAARICSRCAELKLEMKKCSRCLDAWYCNAECQRADWPAHKKACKELAAARARG